MFHIHIPQLVLSLSNTTRRYWQRWLSTNMKQNLNDNLQGKTGVLPSECHFIFCTVYSVFIMPTGTLRLSSLRFFRVFSSVVRQMPGLFSQRRGTVRTLPN
jgi:hypothetical protein